MIYLDSETCGLHGMPVLIQWAENDGPVHLHRVWQEPIQTTLDLIEYFAEREVCGFNLAFDWFHMCKAYTTFSMWKDFNDTPEDYIDELAVLEERARFSNLCVKPKAACDLMLHARKGPYQSLMERDDIVIRRIPTVLAWQLAEELEKRIVFDDIYFAKAKDPNAPRWKVYDIINKDTGVVNPDFKDIKLKFKASGGLKNLYRHAFKVTEKVFTFRDIELDRKWWPEEKAYAPYALAVGTPQDWKWSWPEVIDKHITHWGYNEDARKYARDDVHYTRRLHLETFNGVAAGDNDSELACMVAASRWHGFAIDIPALQKLLAKTEQALGTFPTAAAPSMRYLSEVLDDIEKVSIQNSTKKVILEEIRDHWKEENPEAARRAAGILDARKAEKRKEVLEKLLHAGRFHASFKVIGALSSRMAGGSDNDTSIKSKGGGLNPQGINHEKDFRRAFILADSTEHALNTIRSKLGLEQLDDTQILSRLCGGDFKSFEVSLAAAVFKDEVLDTDLKSGIKVHAQMGMELFPGTTYQEILDSEGTADDKYDKGKKGFFLLVYQGDGGTFKRKLGIDLEIGERAYAAFMKKRPKIKAFIDWVKDAFGALVQPGGIGTKVEWREPQDYAENAVGFRRYFTLENRICKLLFQLAQNPPEKWKKYNIRVLRRDRMQTAAGALQSALYGAAFGITQRVVRAAGNHYIQSFGAIITKAVQRAIWNLQPCGVHPWLVQPMNIHDEIMCPTKPGMQDEVERVVQEKVTEYKSQVPLLAIDWFKNIPNWASKKGVPNEGNATEPVQLTV